jgi:hypothetical protein
MPELFVVRIPTKPHLRKFVLKEFSQRLDLRDPLGIIAHAMLRKPGKAEEMTSVDSRFPAFIELQVPDYMLLRRLIRPCMSKKELEQFNCVLDAMFKRALYQYVQHRVEAGEEKKIAIERWMNNYDILESDITHDALKKSEYRYRLAENGRIIQRPVPR